MLTLNDRFRDAHTAADFAAASFDVIGSRLTQRAPSEHDRMQLFGHLLAAAAARGLQPAEVLAIGLAAALRSPA